jgi:serine/threonine protein kinase
MAILSATFALDFTHSKKVIHGDVKPSNLLLDGQFHARLPDFGAPRDGDGTTLTQVPVSTAYAAPEALEGEELTWKSDIHSLGQLVCFVITQKHTFEPKTPLGRLTRAVRAGADVKLPSVKRERVEVIQTRIAADPEKRPESAKEVFDIDCQHEFGFFDGFCRPGRGARRAREIRR